jgi:hypothetical protein
LVKHLMFPGTIVSLGTILSLPIAYPIDCILSKFILIGLCLQELSVVIRN